MTMYFSRIALAGLLLLAAHTASAASFIGWQTFSPCTTGNNNSGICDTSPDSNSTFDATPVGSIGAGNTYLTGAIGSAASSVGRTGRGQNANSGFLNGPGFGDESANSDRLITNITLADGSPGQRIGPQGGPGTSAWKFSTNNNQRAGDVRFTNNSDYYFQLTFINFDARVGNANSPHVLEIKYLSGNGTAFDNGLTRLNNGAELTNLVNVYNNDFTAGTSTTNVSRSLGGALNTKAYIAPGDSAAFRFLWSSQAQNTAESQIDNLAFQGEFFETAALVTSVNPADVSVPEPSTAAMLLVGIAGLALRRRA